MRKDELLPDHLFPMPVDVEAGKTYYWCSCGKSTTQPLCDQNHCPQALCYLAPLTETVYFCACKQTRNPPFCDGTHGKMLMEWLKNRQQGTMNDNGNMENG